jgi:hypothetical protein
MEPTLPIPPTSTNPQFQPYGIFYPSHYDPVEDGDKYLASLDSDTRDYVLKHTDEFRTKADIMDCIDKLHAES